MRLHPKDGAEVAAVEEGKELMELFVGAGVVVEEEVLLFLLRQSS